MTTADERRKQVDAMTKALMSGGDNALRAFLPMSFGKGGKDKPNYVPDSGADLIDSPPAKPSKTQQKKARKIAKDSDDDDDDDDAPTVKMPPSMQVDAEDKKEENGGNNGNDENDAEEEEEEEEEDDDIDEEDLPDANIDSSAELPISHNIILKDHQKAISALCLEPSGGRMLTGGHDYDVKFWDFNGMDQSFRPFRSVEPCGSYHIRDIQYSNTGDSFIVAPSSAQAKLFDRDGKQLSECIKGDMYLRDMNHTKGHITTLTCCGWHPTDRNTYFTGSEDYSVRLWDINYFREHKAVMVAKATKPGQRMAITSATFTPDAKYIAAGVFNGSVKIWASAGPYHRPALETQAHENGMPITSIKFSHDSHTFVTRSADSTLKVWDTRKIKTPVNMVANLLNMEENMDAVFSPDEKIILTGTSTRPKEGTSKLMFFNRDTLELVKETPVSPYSISRIVWHPRLNQICVGDWHGDVHVFYSPKVSARGALLCATKVTKRLVQGMTSTDVGVIYTPHALPLFRETTQKNTKRKREKLRKDPVSSHRPEMPMSGPGRGGRIGGAGNFTHHVMKSIIKDTSRDEDPREALLKYHKLAEEHPLFVTNAYKDTQPVTIFDTTPYQEEEGKRPD